MIKNYLKIGLRIFLKNRVYSLINVFGLAVAMSVCMLITLMWIDQKSYDDFHDNKNRIYRIVTSPLDNDRMRATIPFPTIDALKNEHTIVDDATFLRTGFGGDAVYTKTNNEKTYAEMRGYFTDPSFFNIFNFVLESGDKNSALKEPNSIVISHEVKQRLFGSENALGKVIRFSDRGLNFWTDESTPPVDWGVFTVTGVFAEQPKSHLKFDVMASASSLGKLYKESRLEDLRDHWGIDHQTYGYVMLKPNVGERELKASLASLTADHLQKNDNENLQKLRYNYQPLPQITPGEATGNGTDSSLPLFAYYILGGLALIVMLASCLNYTSLSVARAITRSSEIGIRKVNGAAKGDLIRQFVSEAFITVFLALILANLFLIFLKKAFLGLWLNQYLHFTLDFNVKVYIAFVIFTLLVGFVAGVYPAIRMSNFNSVKALKGVEKVGSGKMGVRRVLTVSQFAISLFFIISSILVYKQLDLFMKFDYGFNPQNVLNINLQGKDYDLLKSAFMEIPGVVDVSACAYVPADGRNDNTNIQKLDSEISKSAINLSVDHNFADVLEIEMLAGEKIPLGNDSISSSVMVNEMAARELGYDQPNEIIGETFLIGEQNKRVSGVFKNFNFFLLFTGRDTGPIVFQYNPSIFKFATVKIAEGDQQNTLAKLEAAWQKIDPIHPLQFEFYEKQLADNNQAILDLVSIIGFLALMAILIACLGLFGMATYSTERRTKEIGVRKVLGADLLTLNYLLSKEFLKMIGIAILIAAPASYFFNKLWLERMVVQADFGMATLAMGSLIVTVLALLTVVPQSIRIANKNPIETLKVE
jgi:putative ABC transport system permease protein